MPSRVVSRVWDATIKYKTKKTTTTKSKPNPEKRRFNEARHIWADRSTQDARHGTRSLRSHDQQQQQQQTEQQQQQIGQQQRQQ